MSKKPIGFFPKNPFAIFAATVVVSVSVSTVSSAHLFVAHDGEDHKTKAILADDDVPDHHSADYYAAGVRGGDVAAARQTEVLMRLMDSPVPIFAIDSIENSEVDNKNTNTKNKRSKLSSVMRAVEAKFRSSQQQNEEGTANALDSSPPPLPQAAADHINANSPDITISGRYVTTPAHAISALTTATTSKKDQTANDGGERKSRGKREEEEEDEEGSEPDAIVFDQSQMWFNVSFSGPATLYLTWELMCLNGGQTPNVFKGFTSDGSDPNGYRKPSKLTFYLDTNSYQSTNVSNGVGPFCGKPITIPVASTNFTGLNPTNFSLFKDTEPNFAKRSDNWIIMYGFSVVSAPSPLTTSRAFSTPLPSSPLRSSPRFHTAAYSSNHLESLSVSTTEIGNRHEHANVRTAELRHLGLLLPQQNEQKRKRELHRGDQQFLTPRRRRIEWLGDSVTAGYGNLCQLDNATTNTYAVESGWYAWSNPVCAFFGAECHVEAWSGKGLIRNNNNSPLPAMNGIYLRTVASSARPEWAWDFNLWVPDAVVMRLGTNDFSNADNGPEFMKNFTNAVVSFFTETIARYGETVKIFVACGPSRTDYCLGLSNAMKIVRDPSFPIKAAGKNTHFIDLRQVYYDNTKQGGGTNVCFGHPDINAGYELAGRAIGAISAVLNWNEWDD